MAQRPQAKLGVKITNYQGVYDLGLIVHTDMTAAVGDFPAPVPSMATLNTNLATLLAAIATWGPPSNRGSHADLVALQDACRVVYNDLLQLSGYVMSLVDLTTSYVAQTAFILSAGFPVKNAATPQGLLAIVEGFEQMFQPSVSIYTPKIHWQKPLGLNSPGNVKSYQVLREDLTTPAPAVTIGFTTKTSYIDTTANAGSQYNYFVRGINAAGNGVLSAAVLVSIPN